MTLLEQINQQQQVVHAAEDARREAAVQLNKLLDQRMDCDHDFSKPLKGYEHEGGHCVKCGINEVFWACTKR
jgi:hypothetical protein